MARIWARSSAVVVAACVLVVAGLSGGVPARATGSARRSVSGLLPSAGSPTFRQVTIPMSDGVTLDANVFTPVGPAGVLRPLVLMPSSWGASSTEYLLPAGQLAQRGYLVLSYTVRGFSPSGGTIDIVGPRTVQDVSELIDWALANTPADPARIGMCGVSQGAGLALLAAAHDKRVRAVVAMSGWGDLVSALYSGQTRHTAAVAALEKQAQATGHPSEEMSQELADFMANQDAAQVMAYGRARSPVDKIRQLNANGAAIMLASGWEDGVYNADELVSFFGQLTTPKRLEFRPGDHATAELTGLFGLTNDVWTDASAWLDRYLGDVPNALAGQLPVKIEPRVAAPYEQYPTWSSIATTSQQLLLTALPGSSTGALTPATAAPAGAVWSRTVTGGDTGANDGPVGSTGLVEQLFHLSPLAVFGWLNPAHGTSFLSAPYPQGLLIRGSATVTVSVRAAATSGTVIGYLYDVHPAGTGQLIGEAPQTFLGALPGQRVEVIDQLFAVGYDLPPGHRLGLVLDESDPRYASMTPPGSTLTYLSDAAHPATLMVPTR